MRETVRVETVEETITDNELSYTSTEEDTETNTKATPPKTTDNSQSNNKYNPMVDAPDPDIITPSYQPLHRKKMSTGVTCVNPIKCVKVLNSSKYMDKI